MKFYLSLLMCLLNMFCLGQNVDKWIYIGQELEQKGEYYEACKMYERGTQISLRNPELNFRYAECLYLLNNYEEAEKFYYHTLQADSSGKYPEALVKLATLQKYNGKYSESIKNWETIRRLNENDPNSLIYKKAEQEILAGQVILRKQIPVYQVNIWNLGAVNTHEAEFGAAYYDTVSMVYSSLPNALKAKETNQDYIQLSTAYKDRGYWHTGKLLPPVINKPGFQNANGSFSPDKKYFIFARCAEMLDCQLYLSRFQNGAYAEPVPLNINVGGAASTQPSLTFRDGRYILFFSSNRPGSLGGYDIWYSTADVSMVFDAPINITAINSPEDELSPFYFPQTNELFFSSAWHAGLGGYDIFKSFSGEPGNFSAPVNIGQPYNSPANDFYFTLAAEGYKGMLTSNRVGAKSTFGKTCCNDLYEFDYPPQAREVKPVKNITGEEPPATTAHKDTSEVQRLYRKLVELLPIQLYFHNDEPDPRSEAPYTFLTYGEAYTSYLSVKPDYEKENPLYVNSLYDSYVNYGYNKLGRFLHILSLLLDKGAAIDISIQGYASPLAQSKYNINLTSRRIESFINEVKTYNNGKLLGYLIAEDNTPFLRITKLPYGESKSAPGISDDLNRKKLSVYSIEASLERRIEIVAADLEPLRLVTETAIERTGTVTEPKTEIQETAENINDTTRIAAEGNMAVSDTIRSEATVELTLVTTGNEEEEEKEDSGKTPAKPISEVRLNDPEPMPVYLTGNIHLDLGQVKQGQVVSLAVKFRNSFGRNITFARVEAECECSGLKVPDRMLVPEEETTFTLIYNSKGKLGTQEGKIVLITKELNDPIVIKFSADVTK